MGKGYFRPFLRMTDGSKALFLGYSTTAKAMQRQKNANAQ